MATRPLLLGHRGARSEKSPPENTFAAFDFALASGCDGFEFDVRLTADGEAVVCHDAVSCHLRISRSRAQLLGLPSLREVLARYQNSAFLDIELKVVGLEEIALQLLSEFPPARGFLVSSFLPRVLERIRTLDANLPLGLICENQSQLRRWPRLQVQYVIPHYKLMNRRLMSKLRTAGKKVFVWTVNAPAAMRRTSRMRVDGVISDNPQRHGFR